MSNDSYYRQLLAEIARKKELIYAMESSSNCPTREIENHKRILKGLLLEKAELDKKRNN